ncbi:hypothetical protein H2203_000929 [Taxawa tesnikishii (nom. ined.)]|nr:hypothetical protein H2203_000929 [Dothideales sp. JES 119]
MPPKSPVTVARNLNGPGVLPVNPAALQTPPAKSSLRLKLEIRRLPPSLTKDEFQDAFGDEWRVGAGKIDWLEYRPGKVKSPGKPSEQSRAYVHVTNEAYIKAFEAKFLSIAFQDAKGSHRDPNLKGLPPTLGFAPNQRIPNQKQRVDGRQGTIDQDPEFIAFLEAETQPVVKPAALDTATEKPKDKVTSTPLIDDLREKKANKAKAAAAKPAKPARAESKDDKAAEKKTGKAAKVAGDGGAKGANKLEHATKDAVKVLNKQAAKARAASPAPAKQAASPSPAPDRKRERVTPNAIKNMLQRDLGLNQPSKRGAKQAAAAAENTATSSQSGPAASTAAPQATGNQRNAKAPRSPKTERKTP